MKNYFGKDFLWGAASAAYQIEGAAETNGKGRSIWDTYSKVPGNTYKNTTGEIAIDFYNRYEEDIELMKEMGLKAYRLSIAWSRVIPSGSGEVNKEGIKFYHRVIDKLLECGIEPLVTIYHWDLPQALQDKYKGWESRQIIEDYTNYCELLFNEYGNKIKYWITFNEQNVFTKLGYLMAKHPPKKACYQTFLNVNHIVNLSNAKAITLFKSMKLDGKIGPSYAYAPVYSKTCEPLDIIALENNQEMDKYYWMDVYIRGAYNSIQLALLEQLGYQIPFEEGDKEILLKGKPDFLGMNYYSTVTTQNHEKKSHEIRRSTGNTIQGTRKSPLDKLYKNTSNPNLKLTEWNWVTDPEGLRTALRRITSRYGIPIMITENGLGAKDTLNVDGTINDSYRIEYLKEHILAIKSAIRDGCSVLGYCSWSMQDLFSWLNGYKKRYGFIYVDRDENDPKELKRYKKDSFHWYKKVIESNGEEL